MVDGSTMTLRFLGTGGAFSRRYGTTCSLMTTRSGERWLIDCGRQAPDQLWTAGLDWHDIDGQIVTHVHGDHVFGLEDFAFQRYYQAAPAPAVGQAAPAPAVGQAAPAPAVGQAAPAAVGRAAIMTGGPRPKFLAHRAVRDEVWEALAASLRYLKIGDDPRAGTLESYFEVLEPSAWDEPAGNAWRHSETFTCDGFEIVARESEHVPGKPSCSLEIKIGLGDEIAWWSGDCTVDAKFLISIEPRTTIYFHDCTFTDYPGQVHGAFSLLEKLPEQVRRKMVLMHHEDDIEIHRPQVERLGFRIGLPGQVFDLASGRLLSP